MSFHFTLAKVPIPGEWADFGACRGRGAVMFSNNKFDVAEAKGICRKCPVREICQDFAVPHPLLQGVWGGLTWRERRERRLLLSRRAG